tara:strand:+ start:394 stop:621 length:228 start_codon:yes stop_codon:yes gene_type:complete
LGHILTVLLAGTAIGVSYGAMDVRVSEVERRVSTLESTILKEIRDMDRNLTEVKVKVAEISRDVLWLKGEKNSSK